MMYWSMYYLGAVLYCANEGEHSPFLVELANSIRGPPNNTVVGTRLFLTCSLIYRQKKRISVSTSTTDVYVQARQRWYSSIQYTAYPFCTTSTNPNLRSIPVQ